MGPVPRLAAPQLLLVVLKQEYGSRAAIFSDFLRVARNPNFYMKFSDLKCFAVNLKFFKSMLKTINHLWSNWPEGHLFQISISLSDIIKVEVENRDPQLR